MRKPIFLFICLILICMAFSFYIFGFGSGNNEVGGSLETLDTLDAIEDLQDSLKTCQKALHECEKIMDRFDLKKFADELNLDPIDVAGYIRKISNKNDTLKLTVDSLKASVSDLHVGNALLKDTLSNYRDGRNEMKNTLEIFKDALNHANEIIEERDVEITKLKKDNERLIKLNRDVLEVRADDIVVGLIDIEKPVGLREYEHFQITYSPLHASKKIEEKLHINFFIAKIAGKQEINNYIEFDGDSISKSFDGIEAWAFPRDTLYTISIHDSVTWYPGFRYKNNDEFNLILYIRYELEERESTKLDIRPYTLEFKIVPEFIMYLERLSPIAIPFATLFLGWRLRQWTAKKNEKRRKKPKSRIIKP